MEVEPKLTGHLVFADPASQDQACVSTGDMEALDQPQNEDLKDLLARLGEESIKLPPGEGIDGEEWGSLVVVSWATVLAPCHVVKSLQLSWKSGTLR